MTVMDFQPYREEFARIARRRQEAEQVNERDRMRRKEGDQVERDDDVMDIAALIAIPATDEQITRFTAKLDIYDDTVVRALLNNELRLAEIDARLSDMLAKAHVLNDGRRVFKSGDGTVVFDEFGQEVGPEEIDPDLIPDHLPRGEPYAEIVQDRLDAMQERDAWLEAQHLADEARDYATGGEATEAGLAEREAAIEAAVTENLEHHGGKDAAPSPESPTYRGAVLGMPTL